MFINPSALAVLGKKWSQTGFLPFGGILSQKAIAFYPRTEVHDLLANGLKQVLHEYFSFTIH